jgi:colanic acid biosynthesis glycosyl transferase WcaI
MPPPIKPLRILFLTQWFDPEPMIKGMGFVQGLAARGHQVEVVTGFPNYPGGKVYDGYRIRPIRREMAGQVAITRLALYPSHSQSKIGRIANYLSFFLSSLIYLLFVARRADIVYVYHPPMTVGLSAAIARLFRRTPTVLDIQDMWPDTLRATGMIGNERVLRLVGVVCAWVYRHVDRITVISPGFGRLLTDRGVPSGKIDVVPNWAPEAADAKPLPPGTTPFRPEHSFRLLFAGNMGPAQGLGSVLQAALQVQSSHPEIGFYFLGAGIALPDLQAQAAALDLRNVTFLPRVAFNEVDAYLHAADALLVHLTDDPLFAITIPSKTQAYLSAGRPIILAVAGDAADLVARSGAGMTVPPENPAALAEAVIAMAGLTPAARAELGQCAQTFYRAELSLDRALTRLEGIFAPLANPVSGPQA